MSYIDTIKEKARRDKKTIVLHEANDKRVLIAAAKIIEEDIANIILVGDEEKIKEGAYWLELDLSKVIFNADTKEFTLPQYDIVAVDGLSGKDKKEWTKETKDGVTITVKLAGEDKSFEHFTGVKLDGKDLVKDKDYTVKKGGTIVTLTPKTLEKLSVGEHVVTILFDNGEANTAITILEKKPVEIVKSPKTGDNNNILIWTILVSAVIITATATNLFGEKRFNR